VAAKRHGLARVLSKRGLCSRTEAIALIRAGRVRLDGRVVLDPECPTDLENALVAIDGDERVATAPRYLMLNKPRGLVTTLRDERGRDTVYRCFDGAEVGYVAPVGRLDKASEGLLLFTNDPAWGARITDPASGPGKTYHVQVDCIPSDAQLQALRDGIDCDGETLGVASVAPLRAGARNAWLEIVLEEGRNRQIRRLLAALDIGVLRLVRVAIGPLQLGDLPKGRWRDLSADELAALANA
jgi:23S rRNA pseudouridine2605 synthase